MAMDAMPSGTQSGHYTTAKDQFIQTVKSNPTAAINSGMLEQKKQEVPFGGIGKVVAKGVAKVVEKVAEKGAAKATAKALEAAKGPSLAKGTAKLDATSGMVERNITKMKAETNQILGSSKKEAYTKAAQTMDKEKAAKIAKATQKPK